jgi:hypothetical protein
MTHIEHLRAQAAICYGFAESSDDSEIKRKMLALAYEYENKLSHAKCLSSETGLKSSPTAFSRDKRIGKL